MGFFVLGAALLLRQLMEGWNGQAAEVLLEGLLVLGWVALWRPLEVLLFDQREARRHRQILKDLAEIEFVWVPTEAPRPPTSP